MDVAGTLLGKQAFIRLPVCFFFPGFSNKKSPWVSMGFLEKWVVLNLEFSMLLQSNDG